MDDLYKNPSSTAGVLKLLVLIEPVKRLIIISGAPQQISKIKTKKIHFHVQLMFLNKLKVLHFINAVIASLESCKISQVNILISEQIT